MLNLRSNCGRELVHRPHKPSDKLAHYPATSTRIFKPEGCARQAALV